MTFPWFRSDVSWADTVVDLSLDTNVSSPTPTVFSESLSAPARGNVLVDGWRIDACLTSADSASSSGSKGALSVVTMTAPDGWVGAVAFPPKASGGVAWDRIVKSMPLVGRLLSPRGSRVDTLRTHQALTAVGLPLLQKMMVAPAAFDSMLQDPSGMSVGLVDNVVMWASVGADAVAAQVFEENMLEINRSAYKAMHASLVEWFEAGFCDISEVAKWVDASCLQPRDAKELQWRGLDATAAQDWTRTVFDVHRDAAVVDHLAQAGWSASDVRALYYEVKAQDVGPEMNRPWRDTLFGMLAAWKMKMPPARASLYLRAGVDLDEAATLERASVPGDDLVARLTLMGQLRGPIDVSRGWYKLTHQETGSWVEYRRQMGLSLDGWRV